MKINWFVDRFVPEEALALMMSSYLNAPSSEAHVKGGGWDWPQTMPTSVPKVANPIRTNCRFVLSLDQPHSIALSRYGSPFRDMRPILMVCAAGFWVLGGWPRSLPLGYLLRSGSPQGREIKIGGKLLGS